MVFECRAIVSLSLILIPYLGIIGAAITTLLAFGCAFFASLIYALRYVRFNLDYGFVAKSVACAAALTTILLVLKPQGLLAPFFALLVYASAYLFLLYLLRGIDMQQLVFFRSLFRGGA
jgi:O-antigen/teichoic acid export membrane protein